MRREGEGTEAGGGKEKGEGKGRGEGEGSGKEEKGDRERTLRGFGIRSKGVPTETHGRKEGLSAETRDKTQAKPTLLLPDPSF